LDANPQFKNPERCEMRDFRYLVIVPAHNEEGNILNVVRDLKENLPSNGDFIVVNDGSSDSTLAVLRRNNINHLNLSVNLGLHGAVQAGFRYAFLNQYQCAIQFDGDGQHQAKYLQSLVALIESRACDVAIGSRFLDKARSTSLRMAGSRIISFSIYLLTGKVINDPTSGMRAYNREAIEIMASNPNFGPEPDTIALFLKKGKVVKEAQVEMSDRISGTSYLNVSASIKYMLRMVISILLIQPFR
jgi:glycosyltransferase involved in cell wall biosynthesis